MKKILNIFVAAAFALGVGLGCEDTTQHTVNTETAEAEARVLMHRDPIKPPIPVVVEEAGLEVSLKSENEKKGVSYIGHCDGFILQSSCSNGEVGCTLRYEVDKQPKLTCQEGKIKPEEERYKGILKDDLNFSHYKKLWTKDQPALCD